MKIIFSFFLIFLCILVKAQEVVYSPDVSFRSDERVTIKSVELNDDDNEIRVELDFRAISSTGIWMDYHAVKLIQDGISLKCKKIVGLSDSRIVVESGQTKSFTLFFTGSLFKENSSFDIVEMSSNGWTFRGIKGLSFKTDKIGALRRAVDQGEKNALNEFALMYYNGKDVEQDHAKALELFKASARAGLSVAYGNAGSCYLWGYGVNVNKAEAARWFNLGDQANDSYSQYFLACMYRDGDYVLKNPVRVKALFLKSAKGGNKKAQYQIAMLCKQDNDPTGAFNWLKKCANENLDAQYELGLAYYYGKGTMKNNGLAAYWIKKANDNGHVKAKEVWEALELWKYVQEEAS